MDRKYTVAEIEQMRTLIRWSYPCGVTYYEVERAQDIENRLRTYMQNGTTVEELRELERAGAQRNQAWAGMQVK